MREICGIFNAEWINKKAYKISTNLFEKKIITQIKQVNLRVETGQNWSSTALLKKLDEIKNGSKMPNLAKTVTFYIEKNFLNQIFTLSYYSSDAF